MVRPANPLFANRFESPDVILCDGHAYPARKLSREETEAWRNGMRQLARDKYNPLAEWAAKVKALPPELRESATKGFAEQVDFAVVPEQFYWSICESLLAVQSLAKLVTGCDFATEGNREEVLGQLVRFVWQDKKRP